MNPTENILTEAGISGEIRAFILQHFPLARKHAIDSDDSLLHSGIIDSMGVLELVDFIENRFGIMLSDDELLSDVFESIRSLSAFVQAKRNGGL